jgi:hypothetical protein
MNKQLASVVLYLKSKLVSLILLVLLIVGYQYMPDGMPFLELYYTAVTVFGVVMLGPIIRLVVFNEAAIYAEGGKLTLDLCMNTVTPALLHYWFATAISYALALIPFASIAK